MDFLLYLCLCWTTLGAPVKENDGGSPQDDVGSSLMFQPGLYGGDMIITPSATFVKIWPEGEIPYEIHSSLDQYVQQILAAMYRYYEQTCITFRPRNTTDENYILLKHGQGCNSYMGMHNVMPQIVNLQIPGCLRHRIIVHELGHVVGLKHTHQRTDRDEFITINWDNILEQHRSSFNIQPGNKDLVEYDTSSVMHYHSYSASKNSKPTMVVKGGDIIPDAPGLSDSDSYAIGILYNCSYD